MATLLHIDTSVMGENSHTKKVTATYAEEWKKANPDGTYIYRDLHADPVPHLDGHAAAAAFAPPEAHTPEQAAAWAINQKVIDELTAADVVLIGVPMYNFTIPSSLKSWIDRFAIRRFFADPSGNSELTGKKFVLAISRGGSYAPGTPRHASEHQEPYLNSVLTFLGVKDITYLRTEMTMSLVSPDLAQFKNIFEETHSQSHELARKHAVGAAV